MPPSSLAPPEEVRPAQHHAADLVVSPVSVELLSQVLHAVAALVQVAAVRGVQAGLVVVVLVLVVAGSSGRRGSRRR